MKLNLPKYIGHRGVKNLAPENTIESIKQALEYNFKWIEIDVKISKDHVPFLLHDDTLDRTTTGSGNPINFLYKEIKKLNAGRWFNKKYEKIYPPTLEEILSLCLKKNIGVNIELKPNKGYEKENALAIAKIVKKINLKFNCYFSSFDWFSAKFIKKLLPEYQTGILIESYYDENDIINILEQCKKNNFFSIGLDINLISKKLISLCKYYKMHTAVFSSKTIAGIELRTLLNLDIDSIFIDGPIKTMH